MKKKQMDKFSLDVTPLLWYIMVWESWKYVGPSRSQAEKVGSLDFFPEIHRFPLICPYAFGLRNVNKYTTMVFSVSQLV